MNSNRHKQSITDDSDFESKLMGFAKKRDFQEQNPPKTLEEFYATYDPSVGWGTGMLLCGVMLVLMIYCFMKFLYRRVEKWKDEGSWDKFFARFTSKKIRYPIISSSSDSFGSSNSTLKVKLIESLEPLSVKKLSGTDIDIKITEATPCVTPLPPQKRFYKPAMAEAGPSSARDQEEELIIRQSKSKSLRVPSRLKAAGHKPPNTTQVEVHAYQSIVTLSDNFVTESTI